MKDSPETLLIDDDTLFSDNLKQHFKQHGLGIVSITDPNITNAIDFTRFKVLLLDLDMPDVSGLEILRTLPDAHRPLVIMVSGHSDIDTRLNLLSKGADFFIPKPINLDELLLIVKQAINRNQSSTRKSTKQWILRRSSLTLHHTDGAEFGLSSSEYRMLETLLQTAPDAATKEDLTEAATGRTGPNATNFFRSLEVMISRMRTRFSNEERLFPVRSMRNIGYVFHGDGHIED